MAKTMQPDPELAGAPGSAAEDDTGAPSAGADQAPPGGASSDDQDMPNVTPQEQQLYDKVVTQVRTMVFADHALPVLLTKLAKEAAQTSAAAAIGHTSAMLLLSVKRMAAQQQPPTDIPAEVIYAAAQEVVGDLTDMCISANIVKQAQKQQVASAALLEGTRVWGATMAKNNEITPELQAQAKQQLASRGIKQTTPTQGAQPPGAGAPQGPPASGIANQGIKPGALQ